MKSNIQRTLRLVNYESQMEKKLAQEVMGLFEKLQTLQQAISRLESEKEKALTESSGFDDISSRLAITAQCKELDSRIAQLQQKKSELDNQIAQVREKLREQKIKAKSIQKLHAKKQKQFVQQWTELQNAELLDIANHRFLESES